MPKASHPGIWVLSQWWPAALDVDGQVYPHAESYMMVAKARLFGDDETATKILAAPHPAEAKNLGRVVRGFDEERWQAARYGIIDNDVIGDELTVALGESGREIRTHEAHVNKVEDR